MKHFYRDVKGLGNVAVSRHAQARMEDEGVSQELFDRVLLEPSQPDIPDGMDVLWREGEGLRIVILTNPTPNRGAMAHAPPVTTASCDGGRRACGTG